MKYALFLGIISWLFIGMACSGNKNNQPTSGESQDGVADVSVETVLDAADSTSALPVISFETTEYDFGTIDEGKVVEYTYRFTNTGNSPLVINKAMASCGCTVPEWPKEPIAAGKSGVISVKFNTTNRVNSQTKYITISANTKPETIRLKLSGNVIPKNS